MLGNSAARAAVMSALAAISCCSASATSGRRVSSCDGRPGATAGADSAVRDAAFDVDRFGRPADQHGERIDGLPELLLAAAAGRRSAPQPQFPAARHPGPSPCRPAARAAGRAGSCARIRDSAARPGCGRAVRGLEIRGRDAADDGQCDGLLVVAAGDGSGARRGAQGAVLAPEVDLVAGADSGVEEVEMPAGPAPLTGARSRVAVAPRFTEAGRRARRRCAPGHRPPRPGRSQRPGHRCCAGPRQSAASSCADPNPRHQSAVGHTGAVAASLPVPAAASAACDSRHSAGNGISGRW